MFLFPMLYLEVPLCLKAVLHFPSIFPWLSLLSWVCWAYLCQFWFVFLTSFIWEREKGEHTPQSSHVAVSFLQSCNLLDPEHISGRPGRDSNRGHYVWSIQSSTLLLYHRAGPIMALSAASCVCFILICYLSSYRPYYPPLCIRLVNFDWVSDGVNFML